jgi:uncharacterized membrane-anchored protein
MSKPERSMSINNLIEHLLREQERGATHIILSGTATLYAQDVNGQNNSVVLATESQM